MPWFMVDDNVTDDEKVLAIPRGMRAEAMGTWILCGAWSAKRLKDGYVPDGVLEEVGGTLDGAIALVKVKLWKRARGGYQFNNWAKFQRTRAQVLKKREEDAERKARSRQRKTGETYGNVTDMSHRDTRGVTPLSASPIPSHPIPATTTSGHLGNGGEPKQGASKYPPQSCGRSHDPAENCGACGGARRTAEEAKAAAAKARQDAAASERASRAEARRQAIASCELCDARGLLPSGKPCPHEPPAPAGTGRAAIAKFRAATTKEEA